MLEKPGPWPMPPRDRWFSLRVIAVVLVASEIIFIFIFSAAMGLGPLATDADGMLLSFAAAGVMAIPAAFLLPRFLVDRPSRLHVQSLLNAKKTNQIQNIEEVFRLFQSRTIMSLAILNGASFANLLMFYTLGFQAANLLAFLLTVVGMILFMPTPIRWWNWLDYMTKQP